MATPSKVPITSYEDAVKYSGEMAIPGEIYSGEGLPQPGAIHPAAQSPDYASTKKTEKPREVKQGKKKVEKRPEAAKTDDKIKVTSYISGDIEVLHLPSRFYSYGRDDKDHVWIKLSARPIEKQAAWARSDKGPLQAGARKFEFNFLAPNEIQEIVSHEWAPYESVAAKIAEKAAWLGKAGMEWKNLQSEVTKYINSLDKNKARLPQALSQVRNQSNWDTIHKFAVAGSKANIFQQRIDTALVYKNSERRKYDFVFHLADVGSDSLYNEVVYPVKLLQFLSSPAKDEDEGNKSLASIKAPFFFEIETTPIPYIKVNYAACTLVQPTWKGPYIYGVPSSCELHLSFVEIEPLWDSMFIDDKRITNSTRTGISPKVPQTQATPANVERLAREGGL